MIYNISSKAIGFQALKLFSFLLLLIYWMHKVPATLAITYLSDCLSYASEQLQIILLNGILKFTNFGPSSKGQAFEWREKIEAYI